MSTNIYSVTAQDGVTIQELELYRLIMDYRASNGLSDIPLSRALSITAGRHALDTVENIGGYPVGEPGENKAHSWSDAPYDGRNSATYGNMWNAPQRLGTGYSSAGYEVSVGYLGLGSTTPAMTPKVAIDGWKGSPGHNAVLINLAPWDRSDLAWNAIGIGIYKGVAHVWFGAAVDQTGGPAITGTSAADTIVASSAAEAIVGGAGDDRIDGGPGSDAAVFAATSGSASVTFGSAGALLVASSEGTDTLINIETLRFAEREVSTAQFGAINDAYNRYGGRDANLQELIVWTDQLASGGSIGTVRGAIVADRLGASAIDASYRELFGRAANTDEIAVWRGIFNTGADLITLRGAILSEPAGIAHANASIDDLYRDYGGRAAGQSEIDFWRGQLAIGATMGDIRAAIVADPLGASAIDGSYRDLFGRPATADEIAVWRGLFNNGGDLTSLRSAILSEPAGRAHTSSMISEIYQDLGGRSPNPGETAVWINLIRDGASYSTLRGAILDDAGLGGNATATIQEHHRDYLGRSADMNEVTLWRDHFRNGIETDSLLSTLFNHPASGAGGVARSATTAGADTIKLGSNEHLLVAGFDPALDTIDLRGSALAGRDPLADAREIVSLDGQFGVLLGDGDLLISGLRLGQLTTGDFIFA